MLNGFVIVGHASMHALHNLANHDLVRRLPLVNMRRIACIMHLLGTQVHGSFKPIKSVSTSKYVELLHMNRCGPLHIRSLRGSSYIYYHGLLLEIYMGALSERQNKSP